MKFKRAIQRLFRPLSLFVVFWVVFLGMRAAYLLRTAEEPLRAVGISLIVVGDATLMGLSILICAVTVHSTSRVVRAAGLLSLGVCVVALFVDMIVHGEFHVHFAVGHIVKFIGEAGSAWIFLDPWQLLPLGTAIALGTSQRKLRSESPRTLFLCGTLVIVTSIVFQLSSPTAARFALVTAPDTIHFLQEVLTSKSPTRYSQEQVASGLSFMTEARQLELPESRPNIILVNVESLSAVDSFKTSGIGHALDELDELSSKGTLFANFIANYRDSEGAIVSLLGGVPPLPYPGSSRKLFESFLGMESLFPQLRREGYRTEVLSAGSIWYLGMSTFLNRLGVDRYAGQHEIARFKNAKGWGAADHILYEEAIERVQGYLSKENRFFLNLITVSSHTPWKPPDGSPPTEANVFKYVARELVKFHDALSKIGFFERGVLLIVGDHRKWSRKMPKQELKKYKDTADARVFAAAFGAGVTENLVDKRFVQQTELLFKLGRILDPAKELPLPKIFVQQYSQRWKLPTVTPAFSIFKKDWGNIGAKVFLNGAKVRIEAPNAQPADNELTAVNHIRAFAQGQNEFQSRICGDASTIWPSSTDQSGLALLRICSENLSYRLPAWGENSGVFLQLFANSKDLKPKREYASGRFALIGFINPEPRRKVILRLNAPANTCVFAGNTLVGAASKGQSLGYGWLEAPINPDAREGAVSFEVRYASPSKFHPIKLQYWDDDEVEWFPVPNEWLSPGKIGWY